MIFPGLRRGGVLLGSRVSGKIAYEVWDTLTALTQVPTRHWGNHPPVRM